MAQFIVRVELHDAENDKKIYDTLHEAMLVEGFSRKIYGNDGLMYRMLTAEYNLIANLNIRDVIEKAKRASLKTNKKFGVFVSEINQAMWDGLFVINE